MAFVMPELNATPARLALMRAVATGQVVFAEAQGWRWNGRGVTDRFNSLRARGLVQHNRHLVGELTDAGRAWLAKHDKEQ